MSCATISKPKRKRLPKRDYDEPRPYSELSPEAKKRVREWWRECERNDFDCDLLTECFQEILREDYGIEVHYRTQKVSGGKTYQSPEIYWDFGGYPKVSFKADWDLDSLEKKNEEITEQLRLLSVLEAVHESGESFSIYVNGDSRIEVEMAGLYGELDHDQQAIVDEIVCAIEAELEQVYKQACRNLATVGEKEIEYRDSDEYIDEEIEANEYKFDEEGEMIG
jgi:hypothetical protein